MQIPNEHALCALSDCSLPNGKWMRSQVAHMYQPVCTSCGAHPGVYFDTEEWRLKPHYEQQQ